MNGLSNGDASLERGRTAGLPLEIVLIWALVAWESVAIAVTYSRLPPEDLYHVSGSGLSGGASRVLVYLNWPVALLAVPILAYLAARLPGAGSKFGALVGVALCAAVFWPGVVSESDLDARWSNAIAVLGVLVAVALTIVAARSSGRLTRPTVEPHDRLRLVVASAALVLGVPWMAAGLGFYLDGVPVLGEIYRTGELSAQPGVVELHPAVHLGYHHGTAGVLLVLGVLLLSRVLPSIRPGWVRGVLGAYLALMLTYAAGNIANDFWLEQVVKRGWAEWQISNVVEPQASAAWLVVVLSAAAIWAAFAIRDRPTAPGAEASVETT